MKKLFFILTFLIFLFPAKSYSEDLCEGVPSPKIVVKTSFGKLKYEYQDPDKISEEVNKSKRPEKQGNFSGLAHIKPFYSISMPLYDYYQPKKNNWCFYLKEINVTFGYKNPRIFLDNTLKPGTCEYRRVVRHEQGHQQVNIAVLKEFLPVVYDTLEETAKDFKPVLWPEKSENEIQKQKETFRTRINETMDILFNVFFEEVSIAHSKFDNRHNYELEWKICPAYYKNHPEVKEENNWNIPANIPVDKEYLKKLYDDTLKNHLKTLFKALSN